MRPGHPCCRHRAQAQARLKSGQQLHIAVVEPRLQPSLRIAVRSRPPITSKSRRQQIALMPARDQSHPIALTPSSLLAAPIVFPLSIQVNNEERLLQFHGRHSFSRVYLFLHFFTLFWHDTLFFTRINQLFQSIHVDIYLMNVQTLCKQCTCQASKSTPLPRPTPHHHHP